MDLLDADQEFKVKWSLKRSVYPSFWHRIHFRDTSSLSLSNFPRLQCILSSKCGAVSPGNLGWQWFWQSIWKVWYHFPSHIHCLCNSGGALLLAWTTTACLVNLSWLTTIQHRKPYIPTIPSIVYGVGKFFLPNEDFEPRQVGCASSFQLLVVSSHWNIFEIIEGSWFTISIPVLWFMKFMKILEATNQAIWSPKTC